ncbi:hypothetical protein [Actinoplanes couchii]|uniref:DUF5666 domain-containing protein n=1 Tax=Actinoplanes couchii TaxID=403638 RepID=A0ABQ3XD74_9ACTN|nr:hypothetical protein [Actinoplanes couchii]MDR6321334.1 hypothetical protein [Actinoplanes couchii]GID56444.1 hypothetical protein Aco03nite_048480 [Actinoplanes couchii]
MTRRNVLIALVSVLSVALASVVTGILTGFLPTEPTAQAGPGEVQTRYVVKSGEFTVAVHVWKSDAIAHVTDGASRAAWMKGVSGGDRLLLTGKDGAVLDARVTGGTLTGTADVAGAKVTFAAPVVPAPAGVYRASGDVDGRKVRIDVIVLPNKEAAGIEWVDGKPSGTTEADLTGQTVQVDGNQLKLAAIQPGDV